ncbi:MAG: MBL fold metallo-hydrolase RNA specificity domain-containing protein, partial [Limisphaerales bacterium]
FIGYCAENTLGAQILAGKNPVNIFGEPHEVRARIVSLDALSGHADKNELQAYVKRMTGDMRKIFVIHGEEQQSLAFAETLKHIKPESEIIVPNPGEVFDI